MTTWIGQENGQCTFTGQASGAYQCSPDVPSGFCEIGGTPVFYRSEQFPNETHFYAALLSDPGAITPTAHYHSAE